MEDVRIDLGKECWVYADGMSAAVDQPDAPAVGTPTTNKRRVSLAPPQHGGWAFVGLPVVVGWIVAGISLGTFLAGLAFIGSFPATHFVGAWLRNPRRERYVRPLLMWLIPTALLGIAALVARPLMLWWAPVFAVLATISLIATKRRHDRGLINAVVLIVQCALIVPVFATANDRLGVLAVWLATTWVLLALVGSILHVRSLIRAKGDDRVRLIAQFVAVVSVPSAIVVGALASWLVAIAAGIAFGFALWRCLTFGPDRTLKPGVLGMIELAFFILVTLTATLAAIVG